MGWAREWWPIDGGEIAAANDCPHCKTKQPVTIGYAALGGVRFAGFQIVTTKRIHIAVCTRCGLCEPLLQDDLDGTLSDQQHTWSSTNGRGDLFIDVRTGKSHRGPLA